MSVNPYYPGPCGIYSSLLQQRDNQETVSEERLREAADNVLKAGISKPFIYDVSIKDSQHIVGRFIGTTHYCNQAMIENPALTEAATKCSLFFMERLPTWYDKTDVSSLKGGTIACPFSQNLAAKRGLNIMMDSTLCLRARSNGIECRGLDSFEECEIRGQWLEHRPRFGFDQSGNEYRLGMEGKDDTPFLLPKGSLTHLQSRSEEENLIEMLEFYQSGSASQIFNSMMIGLGDLDEAIFKPNLRWAERFIIPALRSKKVDELPICVAVGANHLLSRPSDRDQIGLINLLRNHGFEVKRA